MDLPHKAQLDISHKAQLDLFRKENYNVIGNSLNTSLFKPTTTEIWYGKPTFLIISMFRRLWSMNIGSGLLWERETTPQ